MRSFKGAARKLGDLDLPYIGSAIGVGEDEVHAILEVEASGSGFDSAGRPKMLFEPHWFYRLLSGSQRDQAIALGLAYPKWKPGAYPNDSYPRLIKAMAIDETAALKSASWGLGQVLGVNHKAAGYATPQLMVERFCESEAEQLSAMIRFIKFNKLDDNLRAHDWAGFAFGYNGEQYAVHNYHGKLAAAYAKWDRIKDTPWDGKTPPMPPLPPDIPKPPTKPPTRPPVVPTPAKQGIIATIVAAIGGFFAWLFSDPAPLIFVGVIIVAGGLIAWKIKRDRE